MPGFSERLSAIKGKQEAAEKNKEAEKVAKKISLEREAKRNDLVAERDRAMVEFTEVEKTAQEAKEAINQADAFAAEQGENLAPEVKAEIDALKVEAGEAQKRFEELKTKLDALNAELASFEEESKQETVPVKSKEATAQSEETIEKLEKVNEFERSLEEIERSFFKEVEKDLEQARVDIQAVESMKPGSREKYEAAFEMKGKVKEMFFPEATIKAKLERKSNGHKEAQKIKIAEERLKELKLRHQRTLQEMMVAWWNTRGEYEGGESAEIAKDYTEIVKSEITPVRAEQMLFSEGLDDLAKEYVARELMKKFIEEGRDEDAVNIATLAQEKGFYKTTEIDNLTADFATSLKHKNPKLYQRAKVLLWPNTKPYV